MAVDFELTSAQKKLKGKAREFAREVLRPAAERADALPDPQEAFVAMKPVYEQARGRLLDDVPPAAYGGGGARPSTSSSRSRSSVRSTPASRPSSWSTASRSCRSPVRHRGTARDWLGAPPRLRGDFLGRMGRQRARRDSELRPPSPQAGIQLVADRTGERRVRPARRETLAVQRGRVGSPRRRRQPLRGPHRPHQGRQGGVERDPRRARDARDRVPGDRQDGAPDVRERDDDIPRRPGPRGERPSVGDGDLLIHRNFTWSEPIAASPRSRSARGAYEFTLKWAKTYTGGGSGPIIEHQAVGHLLTEVAARIEAGRYFYWKAAHYRTPPTARGTRSAG